MFNRENVPAEATEVCRPRRPISVHRQNLGALAGNFDHRPTPTECQVLAAAAAPTLSNFCQVTYVHCLLPSSMPASARFSPTIGPGSSPLSCIPTSHQPLFTNHLFQQTDPPSTSAGPAETRILGQSNSVGGKSARWGAARSRPAVPRWPERRRWLRCSRSR